MKTAEVTIAERMLKLSPLSAEHKPAFLEAVAKLDAAVRTGVPFEEQLQGVGCFVYLSAKTNHPDITLAQIIDEATVEELRDAMVVLSEVERDQALRRENHGGR